MKNFCRKGLNRMLDEIYSFINVVNISAVLMQLYIVYSTQLTEPIGREGQGTCAFDGYFEKELQVCQNIIGHDSDDGSLLIGYSAWQDKRFDTFHAIIGLGLTAIYLSMTRFNVYYCAWIETAPGLLLGILFYFARTRDFCLVIFRIFQHGFYLSTDIMMAILIIIYVIDGLLFQHTFVGVCYFYLRKIRIGRPLLASLIITSVILMNIFHIVISKNFESILSLFENSFFAIIAHNSLHLCLLLSSINSRKRLGSTLTTTSCMFELIYLTLMSIDINFSVNYFYISSNLKNTSTAQMIYALFLISLHIFLNSAYIYHQIYHCKHYESEYAHAPITQTHNFSKDFTPFQIHNSQTPDCSYCLNNITVPPLERALPSSLDTSFLPKYSLSSSTTYIESDCHHFFHPVCYLKLKNTTGECVICGKMFGYIIT
ncbi:unnamed protein product [Moneuplotes crassus]|uniref:RING-type domain-containing protein n=1 Tax=Euplotes crassus TaxID=5936 RepID=A0AAD1UKF2_EUPCR|nr:unnamed protein product [Moneuplotes crassus]